MTLPGSNYTLSLNNEKTKATLKDTTGNKLYEFTVKDRLRRTVYPLDLEEPSNLASIKAVYRSLRDNYEYRMRYDESSQFFIREMELKRKYSEKDSASGSKVILNGKFRRNLSLTGLYCHLFGYGENL